MGPVKRKMPRWVKRIEFYCANPSCPHHTTPFYEYTHTMEVNGWEARKGQWRIKKYCSAACATKWSNRMRYRRAAHG